MIPLLAAGAAAVFAFGTAVFYVLSCVERPVMGAGRRGAPADEREREVRQTHRTLQRLAPLLPPANGVVLLAGTALLVGAGAVGGWSWPVLAAPAVYWLANAWIVAGRRIASDVAALKNGDSDADLGPITRTVRRLVVSHRTNLVASAATTALCLVAVTA